MNNNQDISNLNWSNKSILIVEDDRFNAIIISNFIEKTQAKYQVATTGEMAVEMALSLNPDVILMDIKLPDINGLEATRQIKKVLPNIIIIAQTAFGTETDKDNALEAGCNDFISKPLKMNTLLSTISKYI
jgi:two-component system, cell cycle response regulator DivK